MSFLNKTFWKFTFGFLFLLVIGLIVLVFASSYADKYYNTAILPIPPVQVLSKARPWTNKSLSKLIQVIQVIQGLTLDRGGVLNQP